MPKGRSRTKITAKHSTIIEAAQATVKLAGKQPEVDRISLGHIKICPRTAPKRLKATALSEGALKLTVRGPRSVQTIVVYTSDPDKTKTTLEKAFR